MESDQAKLVKKAHSSSDISSKVETLHANANDIIQNGAIGTQIKEMPIKEEEKEYKMPNEKYELSFDDSIEMLKALIKRDGFDKWSNIEKN